MNNNFVLIGRLVRTPEKKRTSNDKIVTEITLAVNNQKDDTSFIKVTLFGRIAETTCEYCRQGDLVGTMGIIKDHNWEDKNGNKHYGYRFIANKITFLQSSKKNTENTHVNDLPKKETSNVFEEFGNEMIISDDDLPFE